ncbi:hypothetical protein LY76DRAFT_276421 [Colletotrichum caudatum]|nr:hypothetical protein LY76DRAFT_276421 [Colletotrichum caudatum]
MVLRTGHGIHSVCVCLRGVCSFQPLDFCDDFISPPSFPPSHFQVLGPALALGKPRIHRPRGFLKTPPQTDSPLTTSPVFFCVCPPKRTGWLDPPPIQGLTCLLYLVDKYFCREVPGNVSLISPCHRYLSHHSFLTDRPVPCNPFTGRTLFFLLLSLSRLSPALAPYSILSLYEYLRIPTYLLT